MRELHEDVKEALLYLRGLFRTNIYVGGSYALYLQELLAEGENKDIDLFIVDKEFPETWAITQFLSNYFIKVEQTSLDSVPEYVIPGQRKYYKCTDEYGNKFDLIFIVGGLEELEESSASDLAKLYLQVNYGPKLLRAVNASILSGIKAGMPIQIYLQHTTTEHYNKIISRCSRLGINFNQR